MDGGTLHEWTMLLLEPIGFKMKIPVSGKGYHPVSCRPESPQRLQNNSKYCHVLGFQSELEVKTPLLQTFTLDTEHREMKMELHWKSPLHRPVFTVPEGVIQSEEGKNQQQSCPAMDPERYNTNLPEKKND